MSFFGQLQRVRGHGVLISPLNSDSIVVDAGAHCGEFSCEIHRLTSARCVLIEANPDLSVRLMPPPGGEVLHAALGASDGQTEFIFRANPEGGSIITGRHEQGHPSIGTDVVSLQTVLSQTGIPRIDLLKLDIEGSEFELLSRAPASILKAIPQISVEFHDFLPAFSGRGLFGSARKRLIALGFTPLNLAFRTHGDVLFVQAAALGLATWHTLLLQLFGRFYLKFKASAVS